MTHARFTDLLWSAVMRLGILALLGVLAFATALVVLLLTAPPPRTATPCTLVNHVACPHPVADTLTVHRDTTLEARIEERDARWDKCIDARGVPVPGYAAGERRGLVCLRAESVIHVDGVAY